MVPQTLNDDGAATSRRARTFWQNQWHGKTMMAIGMADPVLGPVMMESLRQWIAGCPAPQTLEAAGHFVPESGQQLAKSAAAYFQSSL
jgi:tRNA(adenine34) deaminase